MPKKIDQPKETIIKVAREILADEGYDGLSIRNLAKRSGVSIGTIYNYFEDKKVLDMFVMAAFWQEYELKVQVIFKQSNVGFYDKLNEVEAEMNRFISSFRDLFSQVFQSRKHSYSEREQDVKNQMIKRMSKLLEEEIIKENPNLSTSSPNAEEISNWILTSMMMVNHMKGMTYSELEKFIKKIMVNA